MNEIDSASDCIELNKTIELEVSRRLADRRQTSPRVLRTEEVLDRKEYFDFSNDFDYTKGINVCPCCLTKMRFLLKDAASDFDWENNLRVKLKYPNFPFCNQCFYHFILLTIIGIEDTIVHRRNFLKAYNSSMQNEKGNFFDAQDLSCSTVKVGDSFQDLERKDETQSHYCVTFNNAYDILSRGTVGHYLNKRHWKKVYLYSKTRFHHHEFNRDTNRLDNNNGAVNCTHQGDVYEGTVR